MNVTCPSCGAEMDLDVLLSHEDSRQALGRLAMLSLPMAKRVLQYLRLFKPAKRAISHSRTVALIEELLPDLQRQAITRAGRDWDAGLETWGIAIDRMLELRDNGKLTLPLKSHGYLYEVIQGLADKVEAKAEREAEQVRRKATGAAPAAVAVDAALAEPAAPPAQVPPPSGPSPYARRLQAENAARLATRDGEVR